MELFHNYFHGIFFSLMEKRMSRLVQFVKTEHYYGTIPSKISGKAMLTTVFLQFSSLQIFTTNLKLKTSKLVCFFCDWLKTF